MTGQSKICFTQKRERGQTALWQDKRLMTGRVITFMTRKPFADAGMSLLCFQVVPFRDNNRTSLENFAP